MHDAVAELVRDGDTVAIEGFTHLICFAAGHEIIRQRKRDLTLARMTPDVIYDQMIGAGVARKLIFSWLGNPGVGSLHAVRRRIEDADPAPLELEEYSHFGMVCRYMAGAANLPFFPIRSYYESDMGCQKEAAFAADRVIVVVEELVEEAVIRRDPNRTVIPGVVVDAVVEQPFACHPSFAQGYYDRDNAFYLAWDQVARDPATLDAWLDEWVFGLRDHADYVEKMGAAHWDRLRPEPALSGEVDYGRYA
jgi:glutaconate CoA-transferase subunit A